MKNKIICALAACSLCYGSTAVPAQARTDFDQGIISTQDIFQEAITNAKALPDIQATAAKCSSQDDPDSIPRMVIVLEDEPTRQWAQKAASRYDGLPILGPAKPPKRARELMLLFQERLNQASVPPAMVVYDLYFTKAALAPGESESPASQALGAELDKTVFPVVIGSNPGTLDERIQKGGKNRANGYCGAVYDDTGRLFIPLYPYPGETFPTPFPLSLAAFQTYLATGRGLAPQQALATLRKVVFGKFAKPLNGTKKQNGGILVYQTIGIPLQESMAGGMAPPISMLSVIQDDKTLEKLAGAIVVVGADATDRHVFFPQGEELPGTYAIEWVLRALLQEYAANK